MVIGPHPSTAFSVVNNDLQCHRLNQVSQRRRPYDVPKSCVDLRSVRTSGRRDGDDTSRTNYRRSSAWKEILQIHVIFCMLTLRKRHENGTSPRSNESAKLTNNLPSCCTASGHGVSLNVVETIVLGTQAQREEDARAGPTAPPSSEGMLSAMTGGGQKWTVKIVKDKYTSKTRCASLKSCCFSS